MCQIECRKECQKDVSVDVSDKIYVKYLYHCLCQSPDGVCSYICHGGDHSK